MNSKIIYAALLMLALLIVLPVVSHGNANTAQNISGHSTLTADGSPGPAPVPHGNVLVADGTPAPPPVPHGNKVLVADGTPAPPPVPHGNKVLVADGTP